MNGTRINVRIPAGEEFWRVVDDWRRGELDIPPRSEAIRRMVLAHRKDVAEGFGGKAFERVSPGT